MVGKPVSKWRRQFAAKLAGLEDATPAGGGRHSWRWRWPFTRTQTADETLSSLATTSPKAGASDRIRARLASGISGAGH